MSVRTRRHPAAVLAAAAALACLAVAGPAHAEPREFVIDPAHFSVSFRVGHVGFSQVPGMFLDAEGRFVYDEATRTLAAGTVTIRSDSVFTNHEERDAHLRGDDFLDVDTHPEMVFEATGFEPTGPRAGRLSGDLTLLGETHPVALDVTIHRIGEYPLGGGLMSGKPYVLGATVTGTLERSRWGMTYGVDDDLVGDEVELAIDFEARRQ